MPTWWCWLCPRPYQGKRQCQEETEAGTEGTCSSLHSRGDWWLGQDVLGSGSQGVGDKQAKVCDAEGQFHLNPFTDYLGANKKGHWGR